MYTVDYFIKKFRAIPDDEWYEGGFENPLNPSQRCALGHCNMSKYNFGYISDEATHLMNLFKFASVVSVNDGKVAPFNRLKNPKQRILAALTECKE